MVKLDELQQQPQWAVEMKWSNHYFEKPGDLKSLFQFLGDNNMKTALVTTIDKEGVKEVNGVKLNFVPSAVYAYTVGKNTLNQKQGKKV